MLLIEKTVKLLDDHHYAIFREYVKNISIRSYYPLVLIDAINRDIEVTQDTDAFCAAVYSEIDDKTKKKFFQLAHYTFRLISFMSKNYPSFLQPNINLVQNYINQGQLKKANIILDLLLDVSRKTEDYTIQITTLNILAQKNNLLENVGEAIKLHQEIDTVLTYQLTINKIYQHWRVHFGIGEKIKKGATDKTQLDFFKSNFKSKSVIIQLFSKFFYINGLYFLKSDEFYTANNYKALTSLEKELEKNEYVVFPFLVDIDYRVFYLKLRYLLHTLNNNGVMEESTKILKHSQRILFWKNFVDLPSIVSIAIQTSHYASTYMRGYQKEHIKNLPSSVKEQLSILKSKCKELLENDHWEDKFTVKYINLKLIYSGLLLLGDKKEIKQSVMMLEEVLFTFQQISFHPLTDAIFTNIIIGYFSLEKYKQVDENYKRYRKLTDGKVVNPENDITLHGFYYAAKWLETERRQYYKKFTKNLATTEDKPSLQNTRKLLLEVAEYFKIPE